MGLDLRPQLGDNIMGYAKLAAPLLESPVLDDLTLTYTGSEGPRLEHWQLGE